MHQNNCQHFLLSNLVKNEAESQAVIAVSYVRNVRGRAMLPDATVCENKDADQLRGHCEADQHLCFRFTDSIILLLPKSEISSL